MINDPETYKFGSPWQLSVQNSHGHVPIAHSFGVRFIHFGLISNLQFYSFGAQILIDTSTKIYTMNSHCCESSAYYLWFHSVTFFFDMGLTIIFEQSLPKILE